MTPRQRRIHLKLALMAALLAEGQATTGTRCPTAESGQFTAGTEAGSASADTAGTARG
jgi:hypothetical protein